MKIFHSIEELTGRTPLFCPERYEKAERLEASLFCKLEYLNPAGSVKDRAALEMITEAENSGILTQGSTIVEPTSGNTGIGLAAIGIPRGYRVILTMPDTMSAERIGLLKAYGAAVVLTPGREGMKGAIEEAEKIAKQEKAFIPGQFTNEANARAHYRTTGPELWQDTDGKIDCFVAGVGTGGTITGTGRYLKEKNPAIRIIGVEPAASPMLTEGRSGSHGLMGIGANFIPEILDRNLLDEVLPVREEEAYAAARSLARTEGLLVGISAGAALHAATVLARRTEYRGLNIAVLLPDTGDRYLSTPEFAE